MSVVEGVRSSASQSGRLRSKVALITGSTSGIGLGVARALASQGAHLVINGFGDAAAIETLRAELEAVFHVEVLFNGADMSKPQAIADLMDEVATSFGRLDILVNNAGIQHVAPIEQFPPDRWDAVLAINLTSAFHTIRHALPIMRGRKWGRIINVASAHGLVASPFKSAYVAAKHGLVGLTKTVALETAEAGVTCNAICPGYVWTPLVQAQIADQAAAHGLSEDAVVRDVLLAQQPNKRFATVEEIGALALFLAGDEAASITGAAIPIDGGWTAH